VLTGHQRINHVIAQFVQLLHQVHPALCKILCISMDHSLHLPTNYGICLCSGNPPGNPQCLFCTFCEPSVWAAALEAMAQQQTPGKG